MADIVLGHAGRKALHLDVLLRTRLLAQANSGGGESYLLRRMAEQLFGGEEMDIPRNKNHPGNVLLPAGIKPYYLDKHSGIAIIHGDCREILPALDADVDLIVTDPPYGVGWQSNRRMGEKLSPIVGDCGGLNVPAALALALKRLRRARHIYVFGRFDLSSLNLCRTVELIWDKEMNGTGNLELPWGASHEVIQFGVHEFSKANLKKGYGQLAARIRKGSVIRCRRMNSEQVQHHPTQKPVMLLRQLIESSSLFDETVLDPFMGVGSTLVAARLEGRKAIGIEVEEKYCEIAAKRSRESDEERAAR